MSSYTDLKQARNSYVAYVFTTKTPILNAQLAPFAEKVKGTSLWPYTRKKVYLNLSSVMYLALQTSWYL